MKTERENFPFRDSGFCEECGIDFETHMSFPGGVARFRVIQTTIFGDLLHYQFCESYKMKIVYS